MKISLIVAMARNHAIGLNGQMPWHLSADLKRFKQITMGSPVVMGRKTFEAIGRPLPGRENVVISRSEGYRADGCQVFADLAEAMQSLGHASQVFVIGGATLYRAMLADADCLYLTLIDREFAGDTFFPEIGDNWQEIEREQVSDDQAVDFKYSFIRLVNRGKAFSSSK